jgi:hypothetical protein
MATAEALPREQPGLCQDDLPQTDAGDAVPCHPLGVKPSGNALVAASNLRDALGNLGALPDEVVLMVLEWLDPSSLLKLGRTCKALYAFTRSEDIWKTLLIR